MRRTLCGPVPRSRCRKRWPRLRPTGAQVPARFHTPATGLSRRYGSYCYYTGGFYTCYAYDRCYMQTSGSQGR